MHGRDVLARQRASDYACLHAEDGANGKKCFEESNLLPTVKMLTSVTTGNSEDQNSPDNKSNG